MAFTETFGGTTIYPSDVSYRAISLSANQALSWPLEVATSGNVVAQIMDVTPSAGGFTITMPPANEASPGETALFFNAGSYNFTVADNLGNTIVTITPGLAYQVYLTTNTTVAGTWRTTQFGAGTSSATAGSLVGAGIKAINTTLNQSMAVTSLAVNYTAGAADRSTVVLWTGGAGIITLPASSAVGNDWFLHIRNSGSGAISIATTGGEFINGTATVDFNPGDSAIIVCDGSGYFTIGFGQAPEFLFDYVSIDLTGQTSPYTISGSNLNRIAYQFSGTLTANMQVIVPATIQQYWVGNFTTGGSYTVTIKTSGGTGVTVARDGRSILYCNGTDVVNADTGGISIPILVSQGGTGATNASAARTNLGATSIGNALFTAVDEATARNAILAAKSGANSDITSLSGLTTALSVPQGGTGVATLTANGIVLGNGASALSATAVGTTGQVLVGNTGAAPTWATLSGIGVTSFSAGTTGLTPSTATTGVVTLAGTLGVANGGTGATTLTSGYLVKGNGTSAVSASVVYDDGTNVGIGTASPGYKLQVASAGAGASEIVASNTAGGERIHLISRISAGVSYAQSQNSQLLVGTFDNFALQFMVNNTTRMIVDTTGNVGIGTSSPLAKLNVEGGSFLLRGGVIDIGPTAGADGAGRISTVRGGDGVSGNLIFSTQNSSAAMVEAMRIDGSGNVGIGTSSPSIPLEIAKNGTAAGGLGYSNVLKAVDASGNKGLLVGYADASQTTVLTANSSAASSNMAFWTYEAGGSGWAERMRISAAGNVGIGTSSPNEKLRVEGNAIIPITNSYFCYTNNYGIGTPDGNGLQIFADTADVIRFGNRTGGTTFTERMRIDTSGNVGIGTSSPAYRTDILGVGVASNTVQPLLQLRSASDALNNSVEMLLTPIISGQTRTAIGGVREGSTANAAIYMATNNTERMRIDATGNVGIGTTAVELGGTFKNVILEGASGGIFQAQTTSGAQKMALYADSSNGYVGTRTNNPVVIVQNNSERMRIDVSGNVGIGTSSPGAKLHVETPASGSAVIFRYTGGTNNPGLFFTTTEATSVCQINATGSTSNNNLAFATSGTERMRVNNDGNVGIGTASPIYKLHVATGATGVIANFTDGLAQTMQITTGSGFAGLNNANGGAITFGNNTERMRIDASGNVGIGTTNTAPANGTGLVVAAASTITRIDMRNSTTGTASGDGTSLYLSGNDFTIENRENGYVAFATNLTERARIDSSGNLLVGTTSGSGGIAGAAPRLVVEPPNTSTHGVILKSLGQSYDVGLIWNTAASGDNRFFEFGTDATYTARGSISYNRGAGQVSYNVTSDARLKENIADAAEAGHKIDAMQVRQFDWKETGSHLDYGFIAQELVDVAPEAVHVPEDEGKMMAVDYSKLVPMLVKEIQSMRLRLAQLEGN